MNINSSKWFKNEKGYALIEVVLMVTVIAILSSMIVPKITESFKTVRADYLMKTIYSELRFIQAATRLISYDEDKIFEINKSVNYLYVICRSKNIVVESSDNRLRSYEIPTGFNFENKFFMFITNRGIIHNNNADKNTSSGRIKLMYDSKLCKPVIVFDSVGRIRFSEQ